MFQQIDKLVGKKCIIASNTSGIPITKLQSGNSAPGRVVGMHWSNPPHVIPVIEVIAGDETAQGDRRLDVRLPSRTSACCRSS